MQLAGIDTNKTPSSTTPTGNSELGKTEFLKLMMAQLANQDPTSPQSNEAFIAQLAQFATVELMQSQNQNLEQLIVAQTAGNQTGVAELIGKDVVFRTGELSLSADGSSMPITATLPEDAATMLVSIKDENGKVVRTINQGAQQAGSVDVQWDGLDQLGNPLPVGTYTVDVVATAMDGTVIDGIRVGARGHVDGISFENGGPELILGSLKIPLGAVVEIIEPQNQENP